MDLLASVPSVVFGLVGFYVLKQPLQHLYRSLGDAVADVPVLHSIFGQGSAGTSLLTAGIVLAIMITPIITSVSREVFDTVPRNDKEGALALGATRSEMINGVVIPHSLGGLTGAVMLGLGRAMGETIAVTLLIGGSARPQITANVLGASDAMPSAIARKLSEASGDFQAALIGLGVTLFVITMVINITSRRVVTRMDRRIKGAA
jgi:phosphate transport system permease protein